MSKCIKVPVILQMEMVECGAASLAMVMAYYKKWVPLEQLRADCGVSRDGSSAKNILKVARMYGFNAKGYSVDLSNISEVSFPCVIHWNMNHFVVLKKITQKAAYINDPAKGEVKIPLDQFGVSFTGIVIDITPGANFHPGGKPVSILPFAITRLKGTAQILFFIVIVSALSSIIGVISTTFGRVFVDDLLSGRHPEWAFGFVVLFLVISLLSIVLSIIDTKANLKITAKLAVVSSSMFMWHALRLPLNFYSSRNAGDIASRQSENDQISLTLMQILAPLFINSVMMIFYLVVILRYSALLTAIGISSLLINYVINRYVVNKSVNISRVSSRDAGKLGAMTIAGVEAIETIKSSGAEEGFFEKWSGLHAVVNDSNIKSIRLKTTVGFIPQLVSQTINIVILMIGAHLIIKGKMTVGIFFAFQGFLSAFLSPFATLLNTRLDIQRMKVSMERVQDVFNCPTDVNYKAFNMDDNFYKLSGLLELKNLTFGYNKLSPPILEDFSMTVRPGESVALIGASGCGKSTVAKLIGNLYKPWSGEILFDGKPAKDIPREIFTSSVSVVDQEIILFKDSISNNIKSWDKSIEDFEVIMAARDAQIHSTIIDRNGGYDAEVMDGGKNFSGGERQRIEIAGALAGDPTIVILDEATSALDAKTEYDVINAIKDRGISVIIIAHRLSTIRNCNEIIVLDKGRIVQRGTHEELFAAEGKYRELVNMA